MYRSQLSNELVAYCIKVLHYRNVCNDIWTQVESDIVENSNVGNFLDSSSSSGIGAIIYICMTPQQVYMRTNKLIQRNKQTIVALSIFMQCRLI